MLARITRSKEGFADYLITGKRADSAYSRNEKDKVVPLYGNLNVFKKTEIYLDQILISAPKREDEVFSVQNGRVEYFNDEKGYGFIKDLGSVNKFKN